MNEPLYTYIRGQGWVPSTDEGIEVGWWPHPIGITKEQVSYRLHHDPEAFFVFVKYLGDYGTSRSNLRGMNPNYCAGQCNECDGVFERAHTHFERVSSLILTEDHAARLEAAITLWNTV